MKQWGFTLLEILVVLAVVGVITVGALLTFQFSVYKRSEEVQ